MCFKKIFKKSPEKIADITCLVSDIYDLIMFSLIANHKCSSISFDTAEINYEDIELINKYKRKINKLYRNSFIIRQNEILINNGQIKELKPFIKDKIISAIPPLDYKYDCGEDFHKRFNTKESYTDEVLKLFDYFTEQIYNLQICQPYICHQTQIYQLKDFIRFKNRTAWQKIFTELVFDKLQPESIVTNYFKDIEAIKKNLYLFNFGCKNISLIKIKDDEIKITDVFQKNKLILLPYIMMWITPFTPTKFQLDLIYSSICLYN